MEVERAQGPAEAAAPETAAGEMATNAPRPRPNDQEVQKRRFHALLPSTENPNRDRQLSRLPDYLNRPRASDFFYTACPTPRRLTNSGMG